MFDAQVAWDRWVLKGHKGFTLTKQELANGITAAEFMQAFVVNEEAGTFEWITVRVSRRAIDSALTVVGSPQR